MRRALAGLAVWGGLIGAARAEEPAALGRLQAREATLAQMADSSEQTARQQARAAYRLARRRQLEFVATPETRLDDARALDLALLTVKRSTEETRVLRDELQRVRGERQVLAGVAAPAAPADDDEAPRFARPVRGAVVGQAGLRRDPVSGVEVRQDALQILARMNEPVHPPAPGTVKRIEAQPQGGYAVVTEHAGGWFSVIGGLREVTAAVGARVDGDEELGLAGRNLDGAVVVSLELWHGRSAADPGPLVKHRR
jgi:murein DD-endopeptidase MepM/ murein hydrolase activator NlpD